MLWIARTGSPRLDFPAHFGNWSTVFQRSRFWAVARQVASDTFNDGFIHAANLAYLGMLAIFPFFILGAALFNLIGWRDNAETIILSVTQARPQSVAETIVPVAEDVIYDRSGWLLWTGGAVGLWTVSSLIKTIRDIMRCAYWVRSVRAFRCTRPLLAALILAAVVVLMLSLFAQVIFGGAQEVIAFAFPQFGEWIGTLRLSRIAPMLGLTVAL